MLRLATRESPLALWQARRVQALLAERCPGLETGLVLIRSHGDENLTDPLARVGATTGVGVGVFTKALDDALLQGRADLAVHSCKDYPTEIPAGLAVAAVPERAAVQDVLVVPESALKPGESAAEAARRLAAECPAPIGTGSPRRQDQVRRLAPQARFAEIRGNVGTRLRKLHEGQCAALVMAAAGLGRLGTEACPELKGLALLPFDPAGEVVPAPGQAALLVIGRADDAASLGAALRLDNAEARACITAERACLAAIGGGCFVPMGAWARPDGAGSLLLSGVLAKPGQGEHGLATAEERGAIREAETLGRLVGTRLLAR